MKNRKSPGDRLILIICRHRPAATKREIARAHLTGADLEQAKRETEGLVEFEPIHRKGSHKRSWAARLTAEGIWRAIRLTAGYDAALPTAVLAAIDIRALLARLADERNPLALEIAADRQDAQAYRAQQDSRKEQEAKARRLVEAAERILSRPRRTLSARHYAKLQDFLASRRVPGSFEHLAQPPPGAANIPDRRDTATAATAPPTQQSAASPRPQRRDLRQSSAEVCSFCMGFDKSEVQPHDCDRYMVPSDTATFRPPTRSVIADTPIDPLIERIKKAGYSVRGNQVLYAGERYVTPEEWVRMNPHVNV